ncbi:hypothetical protein NAL32_19545 [Chryseobacterium sp. Ch-15]|uniref:Type II toxin-antitoxin system RelE/ParE family toxin n=1 Tax=Chryseobacterium muglaense TaxID=2893752 RepID=A0A9Q3UST7_9FLAO|nr:hypothetical protein [Chryseobacterium muglaense]MBD3906837.1 hypothetical protein [Chryseobacterium muglaense]MCC9034489.1 hypothetical protein [Chryseobacterium muglaense]MCM2556590.1 hypothetical protein [Chryseobacterium muglaense]
MQIELSKIAKESLTEQIEFLEKIWTHREIVIFLEDVKKVSYDLKNGRFKHYQKYSRDIRSALIGKKHVRMFFRKESKNKIIILLFFDMRQNPQKILDLLK